MKNLRVIAAGSVLAVLTAVCVMKSLSETHAAGKPQLDGCVSYVPREWGMYKGGSNQTGLAFEDNAGTLRFLTNLPCGTMPIVALEVRRPTAKTQ